MAIHQKAMTSDELEMRIAVSRRTLAGWERLDRALQPEGTLEMIRDEVALLGSWVAQYPERGNEIAALRDRWMSLATRMKAHAH